MTTDYAAKFSELQCERVVRQTSAAASTGFMWDPALAAMGTRFLAVVNRGAGGRIHLLPMSKVESDECAGLTENDCILLDGHKQPCTDVRWNPSNDSVLASCSPDSVVRVWGLVEPYGRPAQAEELVHMELIDSGVRTLAWHPRHVEVLYSAGTNGVINVHSMHDGVPSDSIEKHPAPILSMRFGVDGRFVTTCDDGHVRVFEDGGRLLHTGRGISNGKLQEAILTNEGFVHNIGISARAEAVHSLCRFSTVPVPETLYEEVLGCAASGAFTRMYDDEAGIVYISGMDGRSVSYYEINDKQPFIHKLGVYTCPEPLRVIALVARAILNSMLGYKLEKIENRKRQYLSRIYAVRIDGSFSAMQFFVAKKVDPRREELSKILLANAEVSRREREDSAPSRSIEGGSEDNN